MTKERIADIIWTIIGLSIIAVIFKSCIVYLFF